MYSIDIYQPYDNSYPSADQLTSLTARPSHCACSCLQVEDHPGQSSQKRSETRDHSYRIKNKTGEKVWQSREKRLIIQERHLL